MPVTRFSDPRIQRFLAGLPVGVLATVDADGGPHAFPMWFVHDETAIVMISEAAKRKVGNLEREPRVCFTADEVDGSARRGVIVHGRAAFIADAAQRSPQVAKLWEKYRADLEGRWSGREMPPDRVLFRIVPTRTSCWGLG